MLEVKKAQARREKRKLAAYCQGGKVRGKEETTLSRSLLCFFRVCLCFIRNYTIFVVPDAPICCRFMKPTRTKQRTSLHECRTGRTPHFFIFLFHPCCPGFFPPEAKSSHSRIPRRAHTREEEKKVKKKKQTAKGINTHTHTDNNCSSPKRTKQLTH